MNSKERPRPVVDIVRNLLTSSKNLEPQATLHILSELINAIEQCPAVHFEPVTTIEALLPFFAPLGTRYGDTVPEHSLMDVFHTKFAGAAVTVIASIVRRYNSTSLWPEIMQRLIACWPSTCMGLRFYSRALARKGPSTAALEIDSLAQTFTSIVTLLQMYADIDALASQVYRTREATDLVVQLWVLEILNAQLSTQLGELFPAICPPTAAGLMQSYIFSRRNPDTAGSLLISAVHGSLGHPEIAYVGIEHVRRSTSVLSQYTGPSVIHDMHANLLNLACMHSKPLHVILLSQHSVGVVTEALVALTSRPFESAGAEAIADCTTRICEYLHKYIASDGLTSLNRSLEFGLLVGLVKAHPWLDVKRAAFDAFLALLAVHLPRYLIYISVLRQVHKSLGIFEALDLKDMLSNVQGVWLAFDQYARIRIALASDAELRSPCSKCGQPLKFRCSRCWEAAYCSKACQTAAWDTHSGPCDARINARLNGTPPDLPEEDVQFALRVARQDFEDHKAQICAKWFATGTLPLRAGVDYSAFPHTTRTDAPSAVPPGSDAVIYAVFPQGTAGEEYYMCDLGLTRTAGAADDETIAVVVQMVSAQPVPAFRRVN
ncbi:hypothetical protein FB451DRAFT_300959 [Mycena latifolia]|nr:hypothetical protein FB451DRAFT_300959 [Mycena latifolia]